jgi:hypothetical protein
MILINGDGDHGLGSLYPSIDLAQDQFIPREGHSIIIHMK